MTLLFLGGERKKRARASSKASNALPVAGAPPMSQPTVQSSFNGGSHYPAQRPQHPVYGAFPQQPVPSQQYGQPFTIPTFQTATHDAYAASQSTLHVPQPGHPAYQSTYSIQQPNPHPSPSPPQHAQPFASSSLHPAYPCVADPTATAANPSSPPKRKENILKSSTHKVGKLASRSISDLRDTVSSGADKSVAQAHHYYDQSKNYYDHSKSLLSTKSTQALNQGAALCDLISSKLDAVITSIDGERFSGKERDLMVYDSSPEGFSSMPHSGATRSSPGYPTSSGSKDRTGSNYFSKVWLYSNSRLPPHLPPFKVYMPTFPLLCLAANYSERVYTPPSPKTSEAETHIPADWRSGTKAMVLKSVPIDDMNTVVFAIRGSQTFMDWAVNFRPAPSSPSGFLDDEGNLCHSGFLQVARQMVAPVADRLKTLLQENPSRSHCSLLITGHSAGGAVAALLYAHMMSTAVSSDLNYLTGFFKRVHCITFGAPPVSLLPLQKPSDARHRKSLFYSFINEGDPVPRADKQVVRSLLKLYASPPPSSVCSTTLASLSHLNIHSTTSVQTASSKPSKFSRTSKRSASSAATNASVQLPAWRVPPSTLSTAGRVVILRELPGSTGEDEVEAVTVDDELLRSVVYGDPVKHMMTVYKRRIEVLATRAATAQGY